MLRNTFIHLPGVGPHRERMLWNQGILDWDRFLQAAEGGMLRQGVYTSGVPLVRQSLDAVAAGDLRFFCDRLPSRETWRLYPEFADRACFLDIETTGLSPNYNDVTVSGALGGGQLALFVKGINLDQFPAYVAQFPLLVTFIYRRQPPLGTGHVGSTEVPVAAPPPQSVSEAAAKSDASEAVSAPLPAEPADTAEVPDAPNLGLCPAKSLGNVTVAAAGGLIGAVLAFVLTVASRMSA